MYLLVPCDVGNSRPSTNIKKSEEKKGRQAKVSGFIKLNISDVKPWEHFDHIVMNLPASALEFLGMPFQFFVFFLDVH